MRPISQDFCLQQSVSRIDSNEIAWSFHDDQLRLELPRSPIMQMVDICVEAARNGRTSLSESLLLESLLPSAAALLDFVGEATLGRTNKYPAHQLGALRSLAQALPPHSPTAADTLIRIGSREPTRSEIYGILAHSMIFSAALPGGTFLPSGGMAPGWALSLFFLGLSAHSRCPWGRGSPPLGTHRPYQIPRCLP